MHISEGVVSPALLFGGWALTAVCTAYGLKKADYKKLTSAAVLGAAFFVASLVHVPLGPGSVHLILNGLLGAFLGWTAFPALLAGLFLQAVLFQYGGLAVLGVNCFDMAMPAVAAGLAFRGMLGTGGRTRTAAAFLTGFCAVAGAALLTGLVLGLSGEGLVASAKVLILAHVPIMFLEGLFTAFIVAYVGKSRPELLDFSEGQ